MLSFYEFGATLVLIYIIARLVNYWRFGYKLPPGPIGLPILGVFPRLRAPTAHLTLNEWYKTYGPIFSFQNGTKFVVVLADLDTIKEALIKQADIFTGRIPTPVGEYSHKDHGLNNADGPLWKEQRRFAVSTLKDFGLGKPILERKIFDEVEYLVEELQKFEGKPKDLTLLLNNSVSNIICGLVFGKRFEYDDKDFQTLMDHFSFLTNKAGFNVFHAMNAFSFIRHLPMRRQAFSYGLGRLHEVLNFCGEMITQHEKEYSSENEPEDYIHAFIKAQQLKQGNYFTDFQLLQSVLSLFIAGTETTSTTIRWAILFMCHNPDVQDRMRAEITELVGARNQPSLLDRQKLPFSEAVMLETQRIATLVPLSAAHRNLTDTTVKGYFIPKDSVIVPLIWAVHFNEKLYPEPEKFKPERFLDSDGKIIKTDAVIPFSMGKRSCIGESLAKMELFIFLTSLIQRFKFSFPSGQPIKAPDYVNNRIVGITGSPHSYDVCTVPITLD